MNSQPKPVKTTKNNLYSTWNFRNTLLSKFIPKSSSAREIPNLFFFFFLDESLLLMLPSCKHEISSDFLRIRISRHWLQVWHQVHASNHSQTKCGTRGKTVYHTEKCLSFTKELHYYPCMTLAQQKQQQNILK